MKVLTFKTTSENFNGRMLDTAQKAGMLYALLAVAVVDGSIRTLATVRIYRSSTGARNYCGLWLHAGAHHAAAMGKAGGYGYHRPSAALSDALDKAGISLDTSIGGAGESAMRDALRAVCAAAGFPSVEIVEA